MSDPGTARRQHLRSLSDGELCALLREYTSEPDTGVSDVMGEIFARHHPPVLAYARTCCRDLATAQDLAAEAFAQTYRAVARGAGPEHAWRPYLLACVRRLAAAWAREGARTRLSDDFGEWAAGLSDGPDAEEAVFRAEEASLVLRAYRSLPERWQAVLWHRVVEQEAVEETAARLGISASGVGSLLARAREGLREAYVRAHLERAASEECRHYGGQLAAVLCRPGRRRPRELGRHLQRCEGCARAERELRAVDGRLGVLLLGGILLWSPASFLSAGGGDGMQPAAAATPDGTFAPRSGAGGVRWSAAAAVAGAAAVVVALLPAHPGDGSAPSPAPAPAPAVTAQDALPQAAPVVAIGSAVSATAAPPASPIPSPTRSASASPGAVASPAPGGGTALVNVGSRLCVGPGAGPDGPVRLEKCTGKPAQTWQRLPARQNTFQLRNAETGTCLEGSAGGGGGAGVALGACRSGAQGAAQLWRFEPDARPGAYRVRFAATAGHGGSAGHLLGPRNRTRADPPRPGSQLVHLPDDCPSASLLFALK